MLVYTSYSYNPKIIDTLKIHQQIKKFGLDEKILNFKANFFESIVFKNDSTIYYNPEGTLHLFEIHLGVSPVVYKISQSIYSGHNFNRNLFLHKETLYSYGGNGLFNSYPGIIHFDRSLGGWLENKIKNYPFDVKRVLNSWKNRDKLMVMLHHNDDLKKNDKILNQTIKLTSGIVETGRQLANVRSCQHVASSASNQFMILKIDSPFPQKSSALT